MQLKAPARLVYGLSAINVAMLNLYLIVVSLLYVSRVTFIVACYDDLSDESATSRRQHDDATVTLLSYDRDQ